MRMYDGPEKTSPISGLLAELSRQSRDAVMACGEPMFVASGDTVFHQGDGAEHCFLIVQGRLKLVKLHEQGKEIILGYFRPGDFLATLMVHGQPEYPGSAQAVGDCELIRWSTPVFSRLIDEHPPLARSILRMTFERMHEMQKRYLELCAEQVDGRLARALLRIMEQAGKKDEIGITIDFPLSRENLADYVGTTLYTVSRTLSVWEKKGWIVSGRERITITDPHALVAFAEGR